MTENQIISTAKLTFVSCVSQCRYLREIRAHLHLADRTANVATSRIMLCALAFEDTSALRHPAGRNVSLARSVHLRELVSTRSVRIRAWDPVA